MFDNPYLWAKALHIISVIAWMAGMLYLPRLYVYHTQAEKGGEADKMLQVMERKLLRYIINPAMIASFAFGIWLIVITGAMADGWLHAKLALVIVGLGAMHGMMAKTRKEFAAGSNTKSTRYFKIFNEIVTTLMVLIVLLVVLKPF